ncbi:transglycosylase domain-containing protein [Thermoactinomyces mirandus]|uniref:PBP1A family penicillin-binding protein n=1 Tax=Thermoactinomyces mirandus TaxID=2756294 RepID=A0A7W2ASW0_9BACL|nr:PBP1A family penicillin-binding protein [Thermoactinomyces mirandus]MBA4602901.1 PBP1A family penicillin-binding protein [Thermoactinomyces mirandus]
MRKQDSSTKTPFDDTPDIFRFIDRCARVVRVTVNGILLLALFCGIGLLVLKSRPLPPPDTYSSSTIFDDQGKVLGTLDNGEPRDIVRLEQIPRSLIKATLAAEDKHFYEHHGFSFTGIGRAVLANIKAGKVVQGASTITQQLARNLYLTHDRTWNRKLKEAIYTLQLELHFSKDEILQLYLNEIYYGHGAHGIGRAAKMYFNKKVEDLNLAESALLAGIPRGPYYYSPYHHLKRAKDRQQHILDLMVKNRFITKAEAESARQKAIAIAPPSSHKKVSANYFRDYLVQTAVTRYGLDESLVRNGGLKIYTTLNHDMQRAAERAVHHYTRNHEGLQGALISVNPHNGHIKAMVGGKDYSESQYNRVFARRQPGSSFKPIVYLSALENGFTPLTKIMSQPTVFRFGTNTYEPHNFQNHYANQPITLREAIARSDNIYAVSTLTQVGFDPVIQMARRLGIQSRINPTPSLALGSYPVSPYEMAQAYSTIAAGGVKRPLVGITKIVDPYGRVLVEEKTEPERVTSPAHAFVLTKLLESVLKPGGTGQRVYHLFSRPAAGKTGTTDWDGWLSGYTPDLVTTVWVGYDQGKKLSHQQAHLAQYIWARYMEKATKKQPARVFAMPPGVKAVYVDPASEQIATTQCAGNQVQLEYFVAGTEPQTRCQPSGSPTNKTLSILHRFLRWLNSF